MRVQVADPDGYRVEVYAHYLAARCREAPAGSAHQACRAGDELVVTKLDRLARSFPDARAIADELTAREVTLALGTSVHDPTDPVGRLLFSVGAPWSTTSSTPWL